MSNQITDDDIFKLMELKFRKDNALYEYIYNSFNQFIDETLERILIESDNIFSEKIDGDKLIRYKFEFSNMKIRPPTIENEDRYMFPNDARDMNMTYSARITATVNQIQEIVDIMTDEVERKIVGKTEDNVPITNIPILVRSKYCTLNIKKGQEDNECIYDPGCHFIVKGAEKVVISLERMCDNKPFVSIKKDGTGFIHAVQITSKSYGNLGFSQIVSIKMKKDNTMVAKIPIFNDIPALILFKTLGIESDRDILNCIVYDQADIEMANLVRISLDNLVTEKGKPIITAREAKEYLINKLKVVNKYKYTESDKDIKHKQREMHLMKLLDNNFLPHITKSRLHKAYFLGFMINKLLQTVLGRRPPDDRDSFSNKRVDLVGNLYEELFRQHYKKMLHDCSKFFKKRNSSDASPINIINQIKPNIIEQGLTAALLTGLWGKKRGVAQMLQRMTYLQSVSFYRRIDAPSVDATTNKLTGPRHYHTSATSFVCCLTGDSLVVMADGSEQRIDSLNNGDEVLTVNIINNTTEKSSIHSYFSKLEKDIYELYDNNDELIIRCSGDHPIYIPRVNKYVQAKNIMFPADILVHSKKEDEFVVNDIGRILVMRDANVMVYDFTTVSDNHNFIANRIVVSNCVETPEHAKVGLTKHLTLAASVTSVMLTQIPVLKEIIEKNTDDITSVPVTTLDAYTKVFLNGEWLGITSKGIEFEKKLRDKKKTGQISATVSIAHNIRNRELRVYCDGGRLYRPVFCVKDNQLVMTKKDMEKISTNRSDKSKITDWERFMIDMPGLVEYIDVEEAELAMVSPRIGEVSKMHKRMIAPPPKLNSNMEITNRYDDHTYVKYQYCDVHPSFLLSTIATNIPFCNHNQGPRNIFQYSQGKQAMGIYATNYRQRLDKAYILYHPMEPLIQTRTAKYTNIDRLPCGENCIVAIASHTGHNMEDSIIFNQSAIDRGLFRSVSLKKFQEQIQKNQVTSQDDIFIKPDPEKVSGMKHGSYDKLDETGKIPEEHSVEYGDIIIGKVTPIQAVGNSMKVFKDSSTIYKDTDPGIVDKTWTGIYTNEGLEMVKMRIRSERIPNVGDKFCITGEHDVLTDQGWVNIKQITMDHKVATLKNGKYLKYRTPTHIYNIDYDGPLYSLRSQQVDLDVTIDHRMWVKKRNSNKFEGIPAIDVVGKRVNYKKDCINNNVDIETMDFPETIFNKKTLEPKSIDMDLWLEFLGIFIADGCLGKKPDIALAGSKPRKITHIKNVCELLDIRCTTTFSNRSDAKDGWFQQNISHHIKDPHMWDFLETYNVGAINKFLPEFVWKLSQKQARILLNSLISCDGSNNVQGSVCYYTSSEKLAEDVMRLALHAGWSGNIKLIRPKGSVWNIADKTGTTNADALSVRIVKKKNEPQVNHGHIKTQNGQSETIIEKYNGKVYCLEVPNHVFYVRLNGKGVWTHNCSRHGQKGTIGIKLRQADMPFTEEGLTPDLIVSPNAFPKRMTIAQLIESVFGKTCALTGVSGDGTPFTKPDMESTRKELERRGYRNDGTEYMYNGMTGKKMETTIFIGPTYYQRLKHLVSDKVHSRARGPKTRLTRQPPEGRSRDGGLRVGEMERDAIIAHGLAFFLKERLMDVSDIYWVYICGQCGLFAQRMLRKNSRNRLSYNDVYHCPSCNNKSNIHKVRMPYAFKLMLQELMAMSIAPRIRVKDVE